MRKSWRYSVLVLLVGIWPQVGCLQWQSGKSVQETPSPQKDRAKHEGPAETPMSLAMNAKTKEDAAKYVEAIGLYEKLRVVDTNQAHYATKKIALLHMRNNDLDRSEQEYQLLWQNNPRDPETLFALGDIAYRRGHFGIADKLFRDALTRQPEHPQALAALAMTLAQTGNREGSVEMFRRVGVSQAEAHCIVASVLKGNRKNEEALREYQAALAHNPGLQRARQEMAQLYQADPGLLVRVTTPYVPVKRGTVELEQTSGFASEGNSRLLMQRPTLPPLQDFDMQENDGRSWQSSRNKK